MPNALTADGVAGSFNPTSIPAPSGTYGSAIGAKGTFAVADNHSVRRSVSNTSRAAAFSQVCSYTQNMRFAYSTQDGDAPVLTATRTAA